MAMQVKIDQLLVALKEEGETATKAKPAKA